MEANRPDEPGYAGINTFQKAPLVLNPVELAGADVAILGAPMDDMVTHRPGTRFGPREIRSALEGGGRPRAYNIDLGVDPFEHLKVVDHGDASVTPGSGEANHRAIKKAVAGIVNAGGHSNRARGRPLHLVPEHLRRRRSIAEGLARRRPLRHARRYGPRELGRQWSHGTPFRYLVDDGVVPGERLVQIGLRGYWPDPDEWNWMRDVGIRWHRMEQIIENGIDAVMKSVLYEIADAEHLFISVDIDALDPAFAPERERPSREACRRESFSEPFDGWRSRRDSPEWTWWKFLRRTITRR